MTIDYPDRGLIDKALPKKLHFLFRVTPNPYTIIILLPIYQEF